MDWLDHGQEDKKEKKERKKGKKKTKGTKITNDKKDKKKQGHKDTGTTILKNIFELLCCILGMCTFLLLMLTGFCQLWAKCLLRARLSAFCVLNGDNSDSNSSDRDIRDSDRCDSDNIDSDSSDSDSQGFPLHL